MSTAAQPWYRELNRYHWFVFIVAALGWLFDTMDQQLFNLARAPAMQELLAGTGKDPNKYGGYATMVFLMGWATGGIAFGILGDRIGRAKTMMMTILVYSIFTGLSTFSQGFWDFVILRFMTGLGVGGEFAVGVALVAEVMPDRARPFALGLLQALSAVGNITAAVIGISLGLIGLSEEQGFVGKAQIFGVTMTAWRIMFILGTLPALLAIVIRGRLKEPERWQNAAHEGAAKKQLGSFAELFGDPRWRKRAIMGMFLASAGVIGLWGIGFFSIDLNRSIFRKSLEGDLRAAGEPEKDREFLQTLVSSPDAWAKAKSDPKYTIQPKDLLDANPKFKDMEPIYTVALDLQKANQTVSTDAILAELDKADESKKRLAQTAEEKTRRQELLTGAEADAEQFAAHFKRIAQRTKALDGRLILWGGITSMMLNIGAFFGIYTFSRVTHHLGRRMTFAIAFILAMLSTAGVFWFLSDRTVEIGGVKLFTDVFWMIPIMGFCQLSIFGGYAIYFPELFPTRLRSTGTSFCYNVGRFVAAIGPFSLGVLASGVFKDTSEPLRYAGVAMCSIFLLGLLALPFAPETKGQPLPE